MAKVLSMAFGILLQIYWYKIWHKRDAEWEKLWGKIGRMFRETLFELEGLLIKIGQILSTRADLLPKPFIHEIEGLTDQVPPSEWQEIEQILQQEWGPSYYQNFRSIEKTAIASASIGEVYKAVLHDGKETAIKVKRPQIDTIVATDFRILRIILWFVEHFVPIPKGFIDFQVLYQEVKEVIERELDYMKELNTLQLFRDRFKKIDVVKIPAVYPELCTVNVLVMEWVEGVRLTNLEELERLQLNRKETAQRLIQVFLPQWLEPGIFHADPHPGNLLLSKDGKIILLDFGMIGDISKKDASYFQGLIESYLAKNYTKAVDCLFHLGFLLPGADARVIEKMMAEFFALQPAQLNEVDLLALQKEMNQMIRALPIQVPTRFVFLGRSFAAIEGLILHLVPEEDLVELSKPVFLKWLSKQGNHKWSFVWQWFQSQPAFKMVHSVTEFLNAPQKIIELKETEQRRLFQFTIYENQKKYLFQLSLLGFIGIGAGLYLSNQLFLLAGGITSISMIGFAIASFRQKKWLKYMHERRR
jgi:predicted unusual protein kinase regulating ubiquinone biosynthesis (AarF/ABC1/UbiB family)